MVGESVLSFYIVPHCEQLSREGVQPMSFGVLLDVPAVLAHGGPPLGGFGTMVASSLTVCRERRSENAPSVPS